MPLGGISLGQCLLPEDVEILGFALVMAPYLLCGALELAQLVDGVVAQRGEGLRYRGKQVLRRELVPEELPLADRVPHLVEPADKGVAAELLARFGLKEAS